MLNVVCNLCTFSPPHITWPTKCIQCLGFSLIPTEVLTVMSLDACPVSFHIHALQRAVQQSVIELLPFASALTYVNPFKIFYDMDKKRN